MHINPNLTGPQNVIAYATNPAFTAPMDPNNVKCGTPLPYPPPSGFVTGLNIDGSNSNTMVAVYVTDLVEDVNEDGCNQTIIYQRLTLAAQTPANPSVTVPNGTQGVLLLEAAAMQLGLVATELQFGTATTGNISLEPITNSVLYLPGALTVAVTYH